MNESLLSMGLNCCWPETSTFTLALQISYRVNIEGAQGVVYQRAYKPISISMEKEFEKIINRIQQQSVPGW